MIESLNLTNFKNFKDARLTLGPFSVLIGANAAGKSNVRDAFLFLHGIGRGYGLADILGEKYSGSERIWGGIRGGVKETAYQGSDRFGIRLKWKDEELLTDEPTEYSIEVRIKERARRIARLESARVSYESLSVGGRYAFQVKEPVDNNNISVVLERTNYRSKFPPIKTYFSGAPVISQIREDADPGSVGARLQTRETLKLLESFAFLDLSPLQMRIPSLPGQNTLGDRGENLSSVLASICEKKAAKNALLEWVRKLTPMDVVDLLFDQDPAGRILVRIKEQSGLSISATSASDGTLRFLAILATLLGPEPAKMYFIEELENGIHPTRLGLLIDLIETQAKRRNIQIVATSHSPLLLQLLSDASLAHASLVYRLPNHPDGRIKPILDIPGALRVVKEQPLSLLHASSWFEDVLDFTEDSESPPVTENRSAS